MLIRGHKLKWKNNRWVYADNNEKVPYTEKEHRPCKKCGMLYTLESKGVDPCLGVLPGVKYACCGHGDSTKSYIHFTNGVIIREFTIKGAPKKTCWNMKCEYWIDQNFYADNPGSNCSKYKPIINCRDFSTIKVEKC